MNRILVGGIAAVTLLGAYAARADVMVMQDGRRVRGELVSVNRGQVIFDEMREGSSSKHRLRVTEDEVSRLILGENASARGGSGSGRGTTGSTRDRDDDDLDTMSDDDGPFGPIRDDPRDQGGYGTSRDGTSRDGTSRDGTSHDHHRGGTTAGRPADDADLDPEPPDFGEEDPVSGRDRAITVSARQGWTDTGIDVTSGDVIRFQADGTVTWSAGQQDGPAGEMNSPMNDRRPIPARPAGALIGRIGTSPTDVFFIGDDRGGFRVRTSGRLYLGINDNTYSDNSGSFRVRVSR
jgi:hypothetical protein